MLISILFAVFATTFAFPPSIDNAVLETRTHNLYQRPKRSNVCKRSDVSDPPHGFFSFVEPSHAEPDQELDGMILQIVCDPEYGFAEGSGATRVVCSEGQWSYNVVPTASCELYCRLPDAEGVDFYCPPDPADYETIVYPSNCRSHIVDEFGVLQEGPCEDDDGFRRKCKQLEPDGIVVQPACKRGYKPVSLRGMTCANGLWDHIPICVPDLPRELRKIIAERTSYFPAIACGRYTRDKKLKEDGEGDFDEIDHSAITDFKKVNTRSCI